MNELWALIPPRTELERAFTAKDSTYDGVFYVAVRTTGIFCRPSCPSRPKLENVEFFPSVKECLFAGYRPCKRCHPLETNGTPPAWVRGLIERGAIGMVTTHDLALARVVDALAPRAKNVHFEDHLENGRMTFDYILHPGVVQKSNALELMRAVGLKV